MNLPDWAEGSLPDWAEGFKTLGSCRVPRAYSRSFPNHSTADLELSSHFNWLPEAYFNDFNDFYDFSDFYNCMT